ncbi:uncharacterized protein LOC144172285 isoform X1 [Haemaphysalis longicornis]
MAIAGISKSVRTWDFLRGGFLLLVFLASKGNAQEGCGSTPDDNLMMSVLKQAADMFMPCVEGLYHNPVHGSILEEGLQMLCRNHGRCIETENWQACLTDVAEEFFTSIKDFPHNPSIITEKTLGCMLSSKTVPREKQRFFAALHWLLLLLK